MNFFKAKETYRKNAIIQEKMAKKLVDEVIKKIGKNFDEILEIGSGTGLLTDEIFKNLIFKNIFLNDISPNCTRRNPKKFFEGDFLDIKIENKFDLILSNAVFQWIDDKDKLFKKLHECIKDNGYLCFTTFGEKNFIEVKETTGFGLNYEDLTHYVKKTGFEIIYLEKELQTLYFQDVRKILEHIKSTGAGLNNEFFWTKSKYEKFIKSYLENFSDKNGVSLTYHPVYFLCKKIVK